MVSRISSVVMGILVIGVMIVVSIVRIRILLSVVVSLVKKY